MDKKSLLFLIVSVLYTQLGYTQKFQFGTSNQYKYDESPFFLRGIYQLENITIVPHLSKVDSTLLNQEGCLSLVKYLDKDVDKEVFLIEMTRDSIIFLNNFCGSNDFHGFFERKSVKSFSTTHNPEKPGHITFNLNLIDKNGSLIPAVLRFPQLNLEFKERFFVGSNVYSISGKFYMIQYRHPDDNSLRPVLKRIE